MVSIKAKYYHLSSWFWLMLRYILIVFLCSWVCRRKYSYIQTWYTIPNSGRLKADDWWWWYKHDTKFVSWLYYKHLPMHLITYAFGLYTKKHNVINLNTGNFKLSINLPEHSPFRLLLTSLITVTSVWVQAETRHGWNVKCSAPAAQQSLETWPGYELIR